MNFSTNEGNEVQLARIVVNYIQGLNLDPMECFGSIEYDPFRIILQEGRDNADWENEVVEIVKITIPLPRYRSILVSGNLFSDAGAYLYQELGFSLSHGTEILNKLVEKGIEPDVAAKK